MRDRIYTATAEIDIDNIRCKVIAHYGINNGRFTVTGEVYEKWPSGRYSTEPERCGQTVDEIEAAFPWMVPLVALHLNDAHTGEPMYPLENGWFWFNSPQNPSIHTPQSWDHLDGHERAAAYLGCSPRMLLKVKTKDDFIAVVDNLRPQWAAKAESIRQSFDLEDPDQSSHSFLATVSGCTREQAEQVMAERLNHDEDYGFGYQVGWL